MWRASWATVKSNSVPFSEVCSQIAFSSARLSPSILRFRAYDAGAVRDRSVNQIRCGVPLVRMSAVSSAMLPVSGRENSLRSLSPSNLILRSRLALKRCTAECLIVELAVKFSKLVRSLRLFRHLNLGATGRVHAKFGSDVSKQRHTGSLHLLSAALTSIQFCPKQTIQRKRPAVCWTQRL